MKTKITILLLALTSVAQAVTLQPIPKLTPGEFNLLPWYYRFGLAGENGYGFFQKDFSATISGPTLSLSWDIPQEGWKFNHLIVSTEQRTTFYLVPKPNWFQGDATVTTTSPIMGWGAAGTLAIPDSGSSLALLAIGVLTLFLLARVGYIRSALAL